MKIFSVCSSNKAGWPSGLRRWFKAPVTTVARVRIPLLSGFFPCCWLSLHLSCLSYKIRCVSWHLQPSLILNPTNQMNFTTLIKQIAQILEKTFHVASAVKSMNQKFWVRYSFLQLLRLLKREIQNPDDGNESQKYT